MAAVLLLAERRRWGPCVKVVCRRLENASGKPVDSSPWLTVGDVYVVLSILAIPDNEVELRIETRSSSFGIEGDPTPSLWPSHLFETVTDHVPSCWIAELREDGILYLAPKDWHRPGFWDDYFDDDPAAVEQYGAARAQILAEEP